MQIIRWTLFVYAVAGLLVSVSLHIASRSGFELENPHTPGVMLGLGCGIVPAFFPMVFREAERARRESGMLSWTDLFPRWGMILFVIACAYVFIQFSIASQHPRPQVQISAEKQIASIDNFRLMTSVCGYFYLGCALYWGWNKHLRRSSQPILRVRSPL